MIAAIFITTATFTVGAATTKCPAKATAELVTAKAENITLALTGNAATVAGADAGKIDGVCFYDATTDDGHLVERDGAGTATTTVKVPAVGALAMSEERSVLFAVSDAQERPQDDAAKKRAPPSTPRDEMRCDGREPKLCVDICGGGLVVRGIRDGILKPNRGLTVVVRGPSGEDLSISQGGTRGLTDLKLRSIPLRDVGAAQGLSVRCAEEVSRTFVPRVPGAADVTIGVGAGAAQKQLIIEMQVEETYAGALKLGLAPIFGPAVDSRFKALALPGDGQKHIALEGEGPADLELVVGFTPYVDALWGGRGYANSDNLSGFPWGFSPYVGVGALSAGAAGVDAIKSLHVGLEWEMTKDFGVAATIVGRRVTRLAEPATVGMPVDSDADIPTLQKVELGVGIVLNVSPDFLKLAQSPISGLVP